MAMGWALHFKQESRNPFFLWILICTPLIYATMAYFLFRGGTDGPTLVAAAVGTGMMGIWSLTTTAAAAALQFRRRIGMLELLVAAPVPFWAVLAPITIAIAALGVYSLLASMIYTRVLFGVSLGIEDWAAFAVAVPASIIAIGMLGFLLGGAFVRFRAAWAVGNLFEFPVWTICGLLIPIAVLPAWVEPLSWVFAPTWGMNALRDAALGTGSAWDDIAMCVALSIVYGALGAGLLRCVPACRPSPCDPRADMRRLRVFAIGGFLSYRALFGWLNPVLFVIILLVPSITQILFFAYLGGPRTSRTTRSTSSGTRWSPPRCQGCSEWPTRSPTSATRTPSRSSSSRRRAAWRSSSAAPRRSQSTAPSSRRSPSSSGR